MVWAIVYWAALAVALLVALRYFRDLGDITQAWFTVTRKNMLFAIRHEKKIIFAAVLFSAIAFATHFYTGAGIAWVTYTSLIAITLMVGFPLLWIHIGLRNQQGKAEYTSIAQARPYVRPEESVIVIENNGVALAHPDNHVKRPHLTSRPEGLGGEDVVMTYCCLTHLGVAYRPEIDGKTIKLSVAAQHGNNLIMKDLTTGEPIQQVYGSRACDGQSGSGMTPWPTFRMSFRGFEKAYPNGEVFINRITPFTRNPLLCIFDNFVEAVFLWATVPHHYTEDILFETMDVEDDRLPRKTLVWGFTIDDTPIAYTEEFVREHDNLINITVGERHVVVAYDEEFESLGVFYNDTGAAVEKIDFWGKTPKGKLPRVETVKSGSYWFVWVNYFPKTRLNVSSQQSHAAGAKDEAA